MAESLKKVRKSNFSQDEVEILVKTVGRNYNVLYGEYSKRAIYKEARYQAWLDVTNEVNQVSIEKRTLQEVKNKWKKCQHLYRGEDFMDIFDEFDSMPLEQRLKAPIPTSITEQEQILHSHPLSPTKLKVTRQTKPREPSPKPLSPPQVEEICLKWNSHHGNMQTMFPTLLLKEQYIDATLVAEGQILKCHKMILSSCSPYFEEVLSSISPYQHPVLFMKDIPFWVLKCLCDFMYTGEVLISQDKLNELLTAAENLKIKGLGGKSDENRDELQKEPLPKTIKEEKKEEPVLETEKKETTKDKKRHHHVPVATPSVCFDTSVKTSKLTKASPQSEPVTLKTSKISKPNPYSDSLTPKSFSKVSKPSTSYPEPPLAKPCTSKILRSSCSLKKVDKPDKLLIKESISKGDILDPYDLLEPIYEEVQKEKPINILNKSKEANKNVAMKRNVQKKVKKRKISDDREESPPPVLSRKGTRSRPNKKIPRFYHSGFDNSAPKIQESLESTIVREPHTVLEEPQSTTAVLPSSPNSVPLELHLYQSDPLLQIEDIKAEPLDMEDSNIDIEDNVVSFVEPEEGFTPLATYQDKTPIEKEPQVKSLKKIRVSRRRVHVDVPKATDMVQIVDVDKIKDSAVILEEDPLKLNTNLDSSIKIMNVESVNEPKDDPEVEENPLGIQITNVISETEENNVKDDKTVCQIEQVFGGSVDCTEKEKGEVTTMEKDNSVDQKIEEKDETVHTEPVVLPTDPEPCLNTVGDEMENTNPENVTNPDDTEENKTADDSEYILEEKTQFAITNEISKAAEDIEMVAEGLKKSDTLKIDEKPETDAAIEPEEINKPDGDVESVPDYSNQPESEIIKATSDKTEVTQSTPSEIDDKIEAITDELEQVRETNISIDVVENVESTKSEIDIFASEIANKSQENQSVSLEIVADQNDTHIPPESITDVPNVAESAKPFENPHETDNDDEILDAGANVIVPAAETKIEPKTDEVESSENVELVTTNSIESSDLLEEAIESSTKDPVLAVSYTNDDLPVASAEEDLDMEVCEEGFSQSTNSFDLVTEVGQNDGVAFNAPGFHITQVISEQIALNEECRLTNLPMDTSEECFEGPATSTNEFEMIVNDLTKIVGETQNMESTSIEHKDITDSLENLLEK